MLRWGRLMRKAPALLAIAGVLLTACSSSAPTSVTPSATPSEPSSAPPTSASPTPVLSGACANGYFPVVAGATWNYQRSSGQKSTPVRQTLDAISDTGFTVILLLPGGGERDVWTCSQEGLANVEQYVTGPGGGPPPAGTVQFHHFRSQGVSVPSDVQVDSAWKQVVTSTAHFAVSGVPYVETQVVTTSYQAVGEESVTTAAGTFQALKVMIASTTHKTSPALGVDMRTITRSMQWWSEGVGVVRSIIDTGSGITTTIELQAHHIP